MKGHWFAIMVIGIWLSTALAAISTNNIEVFEAAAFTTLFISIIYFGYLLCTMEL